jgi:RNA polymerase primary sigma factor
MRIEFVPHSSFDDPATHPMILGPMPAFSAGQDVPRGKPAADLSPLLPSLCGDPLVTREQEVHLFRKMNFLKHQAARLRGALDPARAEAPGLDQVEALLTEALAIKNQIICANLRLVVSVVRRLNRPNQDFAELVSDGYVTMMRAVERFDFSRGCKFSTYVSWAILNNLTRDSRTDRRRRLFVTGYEAMLETASDHRNEEYACEMDRERRLEAIRGMLGRLNDRERKIIVDRFGMEGNGEKTLGELGKELGITKERVRQLEARACDKLREMAEAQRLDLLAP